MIPELRTNRSKGPSVGHGRPSTRHEKIMPLGLAERGSRNRRSDLIAKVFRSRTELRLKNKEKNFELDVGGEGKPMKLLCHKRVDVYRVVQSKFDRLVKYYAMYILYSVNLLTRSCLEGYAV